MRSFLVLFLLLPGCKTYYEAILSLRGEQPVDGDAGEADIDYRLNGQEAGSNIAVDIPGTVTLVPGTGLMCPQTEQTVAPGWRQHDGSFECECVGTEAVPFTLTFALAETVEYSTTSVLTVAGEVLCDDSDDPAGEAGAFVYGNQDDTYEIDADGNVTDGASLPGYYFTASSCDGTITACGTDPDSNAGCTQSTDGAESFAPVGTFGAAEYATHVACVDGTDTLVATADVVYRMSTDGTTVPTLDPSGEVFAVAATDHHGCLVSSTDWAGTHELHWSQGCDDDWTTFTGVPLLENFADLPGVIVAVNWDNEAIVFAPTVGTDWTPATAPTVPVDLESVAGVIYAVYGFAVHTSTDGETFAEHAASGIGGKVVYAPGVDRWYSMTGTGVSMSDDDLASFVEVHPGSYAAIAAVK